MVGRVEGSDQRFSIVEWEYVDTNNRILKCFGKAVLKISEDFNGIEVASASAVSTVAPVLQAVRPGILAPKDAAPAKPIVSAQKFEIPLDQKVNSTHVVALAQIVVSVPTVSPKAKTRKARRVVVQEPEAGSKVALPVRCPLLVAKSPLLASL